MALAPWVLVPLVTGARRGSPRRAAALSALAVFCVGGVNAVATAAVLPLGALWLLTRAPGPRRRRLIGWWVACRRPRDGVVGGSRCCCWAGTARRSWTTSRRPGRRPRRPVCSAPCAARPSGSPTWPAPPGRSGRPAGRSSTTPCRWSATVVLAVAGLLGLARARPARPVLAGAGPAHRPDARHPRPPGPRSGAARGSRCTIALDGVLAPLRNVHKFDPVLRLPLALGVTHVCGRCSGGPAGLAGGSRRHGARAGVVLLVAALLATASPGARRAAGRADGVRRGSPGTGSRRRTGWPPPAPAAARCCVPGSSFGTYFWGSTRRRAAPAAGPLRRGTCGTRCR